MPINADLEASELPLSEQNIPKVAYHMPHQYWPVIDVDPHFNRVLKHMPWEDMAQGGLTAAAGIFAAWGYSQS